MPSKTARIEEDLFESGLVWVILGFALLIALNLATLAAGPSAILQNLNARSWGVIVSVFVFDSWGTAGGLAGVVVLFVPVLFGAPRARRFNLSIFFLFGSVCSGIIANVIWSRYYNPGGLIGAGSSSIAIAGQGVIFALSVIGMIELGLSGPSGSTAVGDPSSREWRQFFLVVYVTLILSSLYFVIVLEPIYIPTELYNWRVHELSFFFAIAGTVAFVCLQKVVSSDDRDE